MSDKTRIITLTDRQPVKIIEANWPVIAQGKHDDSIDYAVEAAINVRRHADGRTIVYGVYNKSSEGRVHRRRAGALLGPEMLDVEVCDAIAETARNIANDLESISEGEVMFACARQCIEGMPAEDLDAVVAAPQGIFESDAHTWTDEQIREYMLAGGAKFHGPNVEHISMPEADFFAFFRDITQKGPPAQDERPAHWPPAKWIAIDPEDLTIKDENGFAVGYGTLNPLVQRLVDEIERNTTHRFKRRD